MQKIITPIALFLVLSCGVIAQTPNRTPEQKAKDDKEMAEFKKNYPQFFRFNHWPLTLKDGSTYISGYMTCIVLNGNQVVDSLQSNFHADMPDTSTVIPFTRVPVGGSRVQAMLVSGGTGFMSIWGEASITSLDSETAAKDSDYVKLMSLPGNQRALHYADTAQAIRISLNGRVIMDWTPLGKIPHHLCKLYQAFKNEKKEAGMLSYSYVYQLCDTSLSIHDQLLIEVKNIRKDWLLDSYNINRASASPAVSTLVVPSRDEDDKQGTPITLLSQGKKNFRLDHDQSEFFLRLDPTAGINASDIQYRYLKLNSQGISEAVWDSNWKALPMDSTVFRLQTRPGNTYELSLRYRFQPETVSSYTIFVGTRWYTSAWFHIVLGFSVVIAGSAFLGFLYQKKKAMQFKEQEESKQQAIQSLKSVQAQLNPHFIFNALGSIQGLVNSGDIDAANQYLSAFSRLMRNTLEGQEHMYNRLDLELSSMTTYIRLEQLRFHFAFDMHIAEGLSPDRIDIPGLLLQPVIENAVLHGVSALRESGKIMIHVCKIEEDLLISIADNGPGFEDKGPPAPRNLETQTGKGNYGLKLTADRISLLNQLQPSTPIELTRTVNSGTTFIFSFKNWLA
jgi:hypothetical protein